MEFKKKTVDSPSNLDYFLVFVLLSLSGNLLVTGDSPYLQIIFVGSCFFLGVIYRLKGAKREHEVLTFILAWFVIFVFQWLAGIYWAFNTAFFYTIKVLIGIFIFITVGQKFREVYFKVIFFLSLTSLFFFFASALGIHFPPIASYGDRNSIFIYTQFKEVNTGEYLLRNSSMFWEPGAFQGYINMAFLLYLPQLGELWKQHKRMMVTVIIALITTFSTTGYIAFAVIILSYLFYYKKGNKSTSMFYFVPALILIIYSFLKLDFLGNKLGIGADSHEATQFGGDRIANLSDTFPIIYESLLFGHGLSQESASKTENGFSNGWAAYLFFMGLFGFVIYHLFLIKKLLRQKIQIRWLVIFLIVDAIILQGEGFLSHPFFLALPFLVFVPQSIKTSKSYI